MNSEFLNLFNSGNSISVNRPLAHALGVNAAIVYGALLGKHLYYLQHDMLKEGGWFYSTIADLQESTSLTRRQQERGIDTLVRAELIETSVKGLPARRYFRIIEHTLENVVNDKTVCTDKTDRFDESEQTDLHTSDNQLYKHKYETKINNHNLSIISDGIDVIDERSTYLEIIKSNIEYDCFSEKERVDELVEIMLDVICSEKEYIRVNGENVSQEIVKSRFLKLTNSHIEYLLMTLKDNTTDVRNVRSYLITALYNAPTTMDSYYELKVNHDLYGAE